MDRPGFLTVAFFGASKPATTNETTWSRCGLKQDDETEFGNRSVDTYTPQTVTFCFAARNHPARLRGRRRNPGDQTRRRRGTACWSMLQRISPTAIGRRCHLDAID